MNDKKILPIVGIAVVLFVLVGIVLFTQRSKAPNGTATNQEQQDENIPPFPGAQEPATNEPPGVQGELDQSSSEKNELPLQLKEKAPGEEFETVLDVEPVKKEESPSQDNKKKKEVNDRSPNTTVTFSDSGYAPATVTIKKGVTVTFVNASARSTWPASAFHPTHTVYPTTGGCLGSMFDACRGLGNGESWTFTFDQAGSWKYHDHLNPSFRGTIEVKE